jgi:hypothetical protein
MQPITPLKASVNNGASKNPSSGPSMNKASGSEQCRNNSSPNGLSSSNNTNPSSSKSTSNSTSPNSSNNASGSSAPNSLDPGILVQLLQMTLQLLQTLMGNNQNGNNSTGSSSPSTSSSSPSPITSSATAKPAGSAGLSSAGGASNPLSSLSRNSSSPSAQPSTLGSSLPTSIPSNGSEGNIGASPFIPSATGTPFSTTPNNAPSGIPTNGNSNGNQTLQQSLQAIASDPEGRILLSKAQERGVKIQAGETGAPNVLGKFETGSNTITVKDPSNVKTLVHELVHATTPEDGNSQKEEGLANVIGNRVESRLKGTAPENPNQIINQTIPLYPDLQGSNNIINSLSKLGITA